MWCFEANENYRKMNSKFSHIKSAAHNIKKNFQLGKTSDLTDEKLEVDEPNNNRLENIVEEATAD